MNAHTGSRRGSRLEYRIQNCSTREIYRRGQGKLDGRTSGIENRGILTGIGVLPREVKIPDWSSPYKESRKAVAVNMFDSDTSAVARDEKAGAP